MYCFCNPVSSAISLLSVQTESTEISPRCQAPRNNVTDPWPLTPDPCFLSTIRFPMHPAPASPNCSSPSLARQPMPPSHPTFVIPRSAATRNLLSCPPPNCIIYRRTSIYCSAGTLASTSPPSATPKKSSPATSAKASSPPVTCSPIPLFKPFMPVRRRATRPSAPDAASQQP